MPFPLVTGHEISFEHQRLTSLAKETPEDFNLYDMTKKKKNTFTITKDSAVGDLVVTHMTIPDKLRNSYHEWLLCKAAMDDALLS